MGVRAGADMLEMANAFVSLAPVRVLWAMKQEGLPPGLTLPELPLGDNCKVVQWADQNVSALWCLHAWQGSGRAV